MHPRLRTLLALALALAIVACAAAALPAAASAAERGDEANSVRGASSKAAKKRAAARKRAARKRAARKRAAAKRRRARRRRSSKPPRGTIAPPTPGTGAPGTAQPGSGGSPGAADPPPASATGLFAANSFWNAPLPTDAALDPASGRLVDALADEVEREVAANTGPWINFDGYSTPVYTVGPNAPTVRVQVDIYAPELQHHWDAVPIPAGARAAGGSDGHMTVYQPSTDTLWEFWLARREADGWHARWGGRLTNVSSNPGHFPGAYGATATGLPLLGGLMTIPELRAGKIDHALALAVPNTAAGRFVWPAQRGDGRTTGPQGIPQGTHFRIDPRVDLRRLGLPPLTLAMARAAQRYGIVVRDTSGVVAFYAEDPVGHAGPNPYGEIFDWQYPNHLLRSFPWRHLQVVAPRQG